MRVNQRPYDRYKDQKVKTLHYVVWYDTNEPASVDRVRRLLLNQGFFLQENPTQEKSVHEFEHFHALKILSH